MYTSAALESQLEICNCFKIAHLLHCFAISKDILNDNVKFAEVVLAKPISVPTNSVEQYALNAIYG